MHVLVLTLFLLSHSGFISNFFGSLLQTLCVSDLSFIEIYFVSNREVPHYPCFLLKDIRSYVMKYEPSVARAHEWTARVRLRRLASDKAMMEAAFSFLKKP